MYKILFLLGKHLDYFSVGNNKQYLTTPWELFKKIIPSLENSLKKTP
jgi:hypothetical protein